MRPMNQRDASPQRSERWERENAAARLKDISPQLESLRLSLVERRADRDIPGTRRIQHVIVATASSRFEIPCGEDRCDGRHDISVAMTNQLRAGRDKFNGSSECNGTAVNRPCDRVLDYSFEAVYTKSG
jgi:hypothetical protein